MKLSKLKSHHVIILAGDQELKAVRSVLGLKSGPNFANLLDSLEFRGYKAGTPAFLSVAMEDFTVRAHYPGLYMPEDKAINENSNFIAASDIGRVRRHIKKVQNAGELKPSLLEEVRSYSWEFTKEQQPPKTFTPSTFVPEEGHSAEKYARSLEALSINRFEDLVGLKVLYRGRPYEVKAWNPFLAGYLLTTSDDSPLWARPFDLIRTTNLSTQTMQTKYNNLNRDFARLQEIKDALTGGPVQDKRDLNTLVDLYLPKKESDKALELIKALEDTIEEIQGRIKQTAEAIYKRDNSN